MMKAHFRIPHDQQTMSSLAGSPGDFHRLFGDPADNRAGAARARAYRAARRREQAHFVRALSDYLDAIRDRILAADAPGLERLLAQLDDLATRAPEGHPTQQLCRRLAAEAASEPRTPRTAALLQLLAEEQQRLAQGLPFSPEAVLREIAGPGP
ncbi:MAG: hypothetical protein J0M00_24415 [Burkholderiales bacterium]|nr:hypothetical protein [Burkholderiales bacterium]